MLKAKEEIQLESRLKEVNTSITTLESADPNHPALYHLRSEKKMDGAALEEKFLVRFSLEVHKAQRLSPYEHTWRTHLVRNKD